MQGARIRYTPTTAPEMGTETKRNMEVLLEVDPAKSAGQGFGSAGQYLDVCIKTDTDTLDGYGTYGGTAGKGLCPGSGAYGRSRQKRKCRKHRTTDLAHRIVGNGELEKYHDVTWRKHSLFLKISDKMW